MALAPQIESVNAVGVPPEQLPRHVAVIMDGNGRWAQLRGLPRIEGHQNGITAVREVVRNCSNLGMACLTLYSFSAENWKRPQAEVNGLMALYARYLAEERPMLMENQVRVMHIGRRQRLPREVLAELDESEALTAANPGMTLCVALNYGARAELADAVRELARRVERGELTSDAIDEERISATLDTAGQPDPDLVIRTAGEMRLSNFLLWQCSYAELYATPVLWPDFRAEHLYDALRNYAARERRFGDISPGGGLERAATAG